MLAAIVLVLVLAMTANDKLETALAALEFTADFFGAVTITGLQAVRAKLDAMEEKTGKWQSIGSTEATATFKQDVLDFSRDLPSLKTEVQYEINHFETRGCVSPLFQQKAFKTSYDQLTEKFQELENEGYNTC